MRRRQVERIARLHVEGADPGFQITYIGGAVFAGRVDLSRLVDWLSAIPGVGSVRSAVMLKADFG